MAKPKAEYRCDDPGQFKVTPKMKSDFQEFGYILIRGLLDKEEMEQIRKAVEDSDAFMSQAYGLPDGEGGEGKFVIWSHPGDDVTGMVARCQKIAGVSEELMGGEVYHYHTKLVCKDPFTKGRLLWHQDYGYWYQNGCLFPDLLSVFLPIHPCTKENGCLQVLEGSHRTGRLDHVMKGGQHGADVERVEQLKSRCPHLYLEMSPGDALFFHCNLLHTSTGNDSDRKRWVLIPAYCLASNNPVYQHHHPQYTPLHKVPDTAIKACRNYTDMAGKEFIDRASDKTVKVGTVFGKDR